MADTVMTGVWIVASVVFALMTAYAVWLGFAAERQPKEGPPASNDALRKASAEAHIARVRERYEAALRTTWRGRLVLRLNRWHVAIRRLTTRRRS